MPLATHGSETPRPRRLDAALATTIFVSALAIRLVLLARAPDASWPHSANYEGDAIVWTIWAQALDRAEPFEFDLAFRTPGVAWTLHALGLSEGPFAAAKAVWCAMSAATVALLYLLLARFATRSAGIVAAAIASCSYASLVLATSLNNEAPYALVTVAVAYATLAWIESPRMSTAVLAGALHALALLLRAEHLAVLVVLVALAGILGWRKLAKTTLPRAGSSASARGVALRTTLMHGAALFLSLATILAPWTIRSHEAAVRMNEESPAIPYDSMWPEWTPEAIAEFERLPAYARSANFAPFGKWIFQEQIRQIDAGTVRRYFDEAWGYTPRPLPEWPIVSMKGPLDFALANHPSADGGFSRDGLADRFDQNPPFSFGRPSHARLANDGLAVGFAEIRAHPGAWWRLVLEKVRRFGDGVTLGLFADNWPYGAGGRREAVDMTVPPRNVGLWWRMSVLAGLIAGSIALCMREQRALAAVLGSIVLVRMLIVVAFYGYARQAAAVEPVLDAMLGIGIVSVALWIPRLLAPLLPCAQQARWQRAGVVAACASWTVLVGIAVYASSNPPKLIARGADADSRVLRNESLGDGAFEANGDVLLEEAVSPVDPLEFRSR